MKDLIYKGNHTDKKINYRIDPPLLNSWTQYGTKREMSLLPFGSQVYNCCPELSSPTLVMVKAFLGKGRAKSWWHSNLERSQLRIALCHQTPLSLPRNTCRPSRLVLLQCDLYIHIICKFWENELLIKRVKQYLPFLGLLPQKVYLAFESTIPPENSTIV